MSESEWIEDQIADLVAKYSAVPPSWFMIPDAHPYDIGWRMGAGELHIMVFGTQAEFERDMNDPRWLGEDTDDL